MKPIIVLLLCLFYVSNASAQKKTFIRIFDHSGKKMHKGQLMKTGDSVIQIMHHNESIDIPINTVSRIKLRRSFGHTLFYTMLATGTALAVVVAADADPEEFLGYSVTEGLAMGMVTGLVVGVLPGAIIGGSRNRPEFLVEGKQENWQIVKKALQQFLPEKESNAVAQR